MVLKSDGGVEESVGGQDLVDVKASSLFGALMLLVGLLSRHLGPDSQTVLGQF